MNLRRLQPRESLPTLKANHAAECQPGVDNLIRGLVDMVPNPDSIWPLDDRAKWLRLAAGIFDLGYKAGDGETQDDQHCGCQTGNPVIGDVVVRLPT